MKKDLKKFDNKLKFVGSLIDKEETLEIYNIFMGLNEPYPYYNWQRSLYQKSGDKINKENERNK